MPPKCCFVLHMSTAALAHRSLLLKLVHCFWPARSLSRAKVIAGGRGHGCVIITISRICSIAGCIWGWRILIRKHGL